jgi:hypothetical protein
MNDAKKYYSWQHASVASSSIPIILMMEALRSSETSVLTKTTPRNIPVDVFFIVIFVSIINFNY